jgi:hypothetical protein
VEQIVPADRALLEQVLASTGVERRPVPPDNWYFVELVQAAVNALLKLTEKGARMLHLPVRVLIAAAFAATAVAAVVAVVLVLRALLAGLRRQPLGAAPETSSKEAPRTGLALDAAGWRAELERRLAAGCMAEALAAAWWWLARSLAGFEVEPDWTSRDLIARGRRPDLSRLIRRLDAFTYGPLRPEPEDLRGLVARLEAALV